MQNLINKTPFAVAVISALAASAAAQQAPTGQTLQTAPPPEESRIITPRRSDTTRAGVQSEKTLGKIDWADVRTIIAETRQRDQTFTRLDSTQALTTNRSSVPARAGIRPVSREQLQQFETVNENEVGQTRVPVLVPVTDRTLGWTRLYASENAYTAVMELENGAWVEFIGTRMRTITKDARIAKERFAQRRRAQRSLTGLNANYTISKHEEGIDLSFSKFNVAYMVSVYCDAPETDTRCNDENYITSLASSVALLNEAEGGVQ